MDAVPGKSGHGGDQPATLFTLILYQLTFYMLQIENCHLKGDFRTLRRM